MKKFRNEFINIKRSRCRRTKGKVFLIPVKQKRLFLLLQIAKDVSFKTYENKARFDLDWYSFSHKRYPSRSKLIPFHAIC
jgi:hypothetical protein